MSRTHEGNVLPLVRDLPPLPSTHAPPLAFPTTIALDPAARGRVSTSHSLVRRLRTYECDSSSFVTACGAWRPRPSTRQRPSCLHARPLLHRLHHCTSGPGLLRGQAPDAHSPFLKLCVSTWGACEAKTTY